MDLYYFDSSTYQNKIKTELLNKVFKAFNIYKDISYKQPLQKAQETLINQLKSDVWAFLDSYSFDKYLYKYKICNTHLCMDATITNFIISICKVIDFYNFDKKDSFKKSELLKNNFTAGNTYPLEYNGFRFDIQVKKNSTNVIFSKELFELLN